MQTFFTSDFLPSEQYSVIEYCGDTCNVLFSSPNKKPALRKFSSLKNKISNRLEVIYLYSSGVEILVKTK